MDGILVIDKPPKVICHELTTWVKKLLNVRAGHAGTLDPDVSGVLPIALGKSTKLLQYIAAKKKTYVGIIKFKDEKITDNQVYSLFKEFTGKISQTPPLISAVKKVPRKRTIFSLEFLERNGKLVLFKADVEAGTYIRTLCEDIGKKCGGARMEELRRVAVGEITEKEAIPLNKLIDAYNNGKIDSLVHKPEEFIDFPKVEINKDALNAVLHGAKIAKNGILKCDRFGVKELVSVYCDGKFVGIGLSIIRSKEMEAMKSGFVIGMERVHYSKPI
ncbi:MAG: RNA-guided pseudouridylation complex pseudouridine synthase subunit Cbf5 [Candidatus Micrarchaeota archaeon]